MAEAAAELTEAREKLRAVEGELATAKATLDAPGIAEAKLGVAKAELGVAEAKWQAATDEGQRDRLGRLVDTAQKVVDAATMAYQNGLQAAAPPPRYTCLFLVSCVEQHLEMGEYCL